MNDETIDRLVKAGFTNEEVVAMQRIIERGLRQVILVNPWLWSNPPKTVLEGVIVKAKHLFNQ